MKKAGSGKRAKFVLAACCLIILTASLGLTQSGGLVPTKVLSSEGSAAYSKDSKLMATSGGVKIKIWQTDTGRLLRTLEGHTAPVSAFAFSPDNKLLASSSRDKTFRIWDISTGNSLKTIKLPYNFTILSGIVFAIAFSPDSSKIALGSDETYIYEVSTGNQSLKIEATYGDNPITRTTSSHFIYSLEFSPDGKFLVTGNTDCTAKIFSLADGKQIGILKGHQSYIYAVAYSPNGKLIAVGGGLPENSITELYNLTNDPTISLWDASTYKLVKKLEGHKKIVSGLCFTTDGKKLISVSYDKTIKIWDVESGSETKSIALNAQVLKMALRPDGSEMAVGVFNEPNLSELRIYNMMAVLGI